VSETGTPRTLLIERVLRHPWIAPLVVLGLVVVLLFRLDAQQRDALDSARRDAAANAERRGSALADEIGNAINERIGALRATRIREAVADSTILAAVDSAARDISGVSAVSFIFADGTILRGSNALLGSAGADIGRGSILGDPYVRSQETQRSAASGLVELPAGRRIFVFDPVVSSDSTEVVSTVVGELDPGAILRSALIALTNRDQAGFDVDFQYMLFAHGGAQITTVQSPPGWLSIDHPIRVADTEWVLRFAYEPVDDRTYATIRLLVGTTGTLLGLALAERMGVP
jgi:hypothetical protein